SGTLTVAGQLFTVTQAAAPCDFTITTGSPVSMSQFASSSSFNFTSSASGCPLPISSNTSWLNVTGTNYSGNSGTVNFTVDANTFAAARSGAITLGTQSFTVNQAPSTCAYTLTSYAPATPFSRNGGGGTIPVNFTPAQCGAPAVVVNAPAGMISLTGGS